jgi:Glycoside-hydrolase family GH114
MRAAYHIVIPPFLLLQMVASCASSGTTAASGAGDGGDATHGAGTAGTAGTTVRAGAGGAGDNQGGGGSPSLGGNAGNAAGASGAGGTPSVGDDAGSKAPIWRPKPGVSWQWQLTGALDTSLDVQMYDIDLFTNSPAAIQALHTAGRIVVCYFSAGSYEPDRPDSTKLQQTGLGNTLDGWPDEKWLDIRSAAVKDIMKARLDLAASKGCDGVEPDNVDGYDNNNGLGLTKQDQLGYDEFLATEGHARNLSVGLKNSLGLVSSLVSSFDWALNEECLKYSECSQLAPFIAAGKAVFHCEYAKSTTGICNNDPQGFSTIIKNLNLDAWRLACK